MSTKQGEIRVENIKHTQALIKDRKDRDDTIVKLKKEISEHLDMIASLTTENGELTLKLSKHKKAQEDGYLAVACNQDGMIVHIAQVLGYSQYTFPQEIPEVYNKKNYNRYPTLKIKDGRIMTDTQKLKKYKTLGVI